MFISITVLYQEPFWVALYEVTTEKEYNICKITFGAEPKDTQVYEFLLNNYRHLDFSMIKQKSVKQDKHINPKRMQRIVKKQTEESKGIGTKAQQALKQIQEQNKLQRKEISKEQKEEFKQRIYDLKQQKRKDKHKGH